MIKATTEKQQNWWLLLAVGLVITAGGLSVAADTGLLKVKRPHEMIRGFKSRRPGKRKEKGMIEKGGTLWI